MTAAFVDLPNPFPGLRPFLESEQHLYFGRERKVDRMVDKIASKRFLAVVGGSGSGKSSLVNCGLKPALRRGWLAEAGTSWRMVQIRPGSNPIRALAAGLAREQSLFAYLQGNHPSGGLLEDMIDATLRLSSLGLVEIYQQARLDPETNMLLVVDQFEELFRYRNLGGGQGPEAAAFVRLLLEAVAQQQYPIYVVLTMRSDFLGDCSHFDGLPEAINEGQFLVPRLTREERRSAIEGPLGAVGVSISPVLLTRLINDVGDNPDQLSILQHALNRTFARWHHETRGAGPIMLSHYETIGTMAHALDLHAERAYNELPLERQKQICARVWKALTDCGTDPRGIRRPTKFSSLCGIADATEDEVLEVLSVFRKPSRSFLMPESSEPVSAESVIDISHESIMRVWKRLKVWAEEEAESAKEYRRWSDRAAGYRRQRFGLMQDPDLQAALDFVKLQQPNSKWAELYGGQLEDLVKFLAASERKRDEDKAEAELERRWSTLWQPSTRVVTVGFALAELLEYRDELLPPTHNPASTTSMGMPSSQAFLDAFLSFGKITLLACGAVVFYALLNKYGRRLHRRFAFSRILQEVRSKAKQREKGLVKSSGEVLLQRATFAPWWRRAIALVIDMLALYLSLMLMAIPLAAIRMAAIELDSNVVMLILYPIALSFTFLHHALAVGSNWQATLGMRTLHIYVADVNGARLSRWDAVRRQFIKILLFPFSCYWPFVFPVAARFFPNSLFVQRKQWLSDIATKTVVLVRPAESA